MDLSWSYREKVDAPTLVLDLKSDLMKQIRRFTADVNRLENVYFGINEGAKTLRGVLCKQCSNTVKSKSAELHSKPERQHPKKKLKTMSPAFQQLVDELTIKLFQLERYQNEGNDDDEYCTPQQYYAHEKLELESAHAKEIQDMQAEITELESKHTKEIKERDKRIHDLEKQLQSEVHGRNKEQKRLETKLETAERTIEQYKKDLGRKQEARSNRSFSSRYVSPRDTTDDETKQLREKLSSKDIALQASQKENESLQTKVKQLSKENEDIKESMKIIRGAKDEALHELHEDNKNLHSRIRELSEELGDLQELRSDLKGQNDSLIKSLSMKDDEVKTMEIKLKELQKTMKKEKVLGLCKERSGMGKTMVDMIIKEMKRRVGGLLERDNTELTIRQCAGTSDIPNGPLVVLCLNMSRIGTNIQDALGGIQADKNVYVMVLHHISKENSSSLTPTSLCVTGSELRQLGGIIDMAFSSDSGLYECDLNSNAIDKITSIMRKY